MGLGRGKTKCPRKFRDRYGIWRVCTKPRDKDGYHPGKCRA